MKRFEAAELDEAVQYAAAGGQALHLHRLIGNRERTPSCFVQAIDRGEHIAHLFDRDEARLRSTVRGLGVRVVVVERAGTPKQHVDLCAGPLRGAVARCEG